MNYYLIHYKIWYRIFYFSNLYIFYWYLTNHSAALWTAIVVTTDRQQKESPSAFSLAMKTKTSLQERKLKELVLLLQSHSTFPLFFHWRPSGSLFQFPLTLTCVRQKLSSPTNRKTGRARRKIGLKERKCRNAGCHAPRLPSWLN